jgi:glycosyltransferase involved in cell wall biosynthesis
MTRDQSIVRRVPGSGIDLALFHQSAPRPGQPTFLLVARLLREKGIGEFVEAARSLRARYPQARFQLLGHFDPNPSAIRKDEVDKWVSEGVVEYLGTTKDVRPYLADCTAFVLPSYYREGIPRSILEAMATGRAIVTTDLPGCADTVVDGVNGFLVPKKQPDRLAAVLERLILQPALAAKMGEASRRLASDRFDVHAVNRLLLSEMGLVSTSERVRGT